MRLSTSCTKNKCRRSKDMVQYDTRAPFEQTVETISPTGCSGAVSAPGSPWIPRPSSILPSAILRIQIEKLSVRQDDTVWSGSKDIGAFSLQCGRIGRTHRQGADTHDLGGATRSQDGWRDVTACLHTEPQRCFNLGVSHQQASPGLRLKRHQMSENSRLLLPTCRRAARPAACRRAWQRPWNSLRPLRPPPRPAPRRAAGRPPPLRLPPENSSTRYRWRCEITHLMQHRIHRPVAG